MLTIDEAMWLEQIAKSCTTEAQAKNWMAFVRKKMRGTEQGSLAHLQCEHILRHSTSYWLHDWGGDIPPPPTMPAPPPPTRIREGYSRK